MPTISQLPATAQVTAADQIPISQGGSVCSVNVGNLLASTQPAILVPTGSLLGRTSLGTGGPDPIAVGIGLALSTGTLAATGADHADFVVQGTLTTTDQAVLNSGGTPKLLQLSLLRGLFAPGSNISIDQNGTISSTAIASTTTVTAAAYSISSLPSVTTIGSGDLVGISQAGTDHTISYANLIDGQTVNQLQAATAASDTDDVLVSQGGTILARQTLAAIWTWLNGKLPTYAVPAVELTTNTALTAAAHGGHVLVFSQPVTITATAASLGAGFTCNLINVSAGNVTLGASIVSSSGTATLGPGQAAELMCVTYSGGTLIYASTSSAASSSSSASPPAQVGALAVTSTSSTSVTLSWTALSPAPTSYTVEYRVTGTGTWLSAPSVTTPGCTVSSLLAATSYDFVVSAANGAGVGIPSAILTTITAAGLGLPGQVTALAAGSATTSTVALSWSLPTTGGAVGSYTVQYRVTGTTAWSTGTSGLTATSFTVTGLSAGTSYGFQVFAVNATGSGTASSVVTIGTTAAGGAVSSITWNMVPSGSYTHGSGAIAINAHISPSTAAVQFGFSTSATTLPVSWTLGNYVNSDLWGAYVNTPATAGTYYAWAEGTDGSAPTVYATAFTVV